MEMENARENKNKPKLFLLVLRCDSEPLDGKIISAQAHIVARPVHRGGDGEVVVMVFGRSRDRIHHRHKTNSTCNIYAVFFLLIFFSSLRSFYSFETLSEQARSQDLL